MAGNTHPIVTAPASENTTVDAMIERILAGRDGNGNGRGSDVAHMVYRPSWSNRPPETEPVVSIDGGRVGSAGNMTLIVAGSGYGKSAICEAIIAARLNPECDTLGLHVSTDKNVVYIDTERSRPDHWQSWYRVMRRAGITENTTPDGIVFELVASIPKIGDRRTYLWQHFNEKNGLIVLDGLADFVLDVNEPVECNEFLFELLARAKNFEICVLATLHHNPQPGSEKARGHLGSEAMRRAESVMLLKRDAATGQRTLTMNFQHGKNRNDTDTLETYFRWDTEREMFVSCENEVSDTKPEAENRYADLIAGLPDEPISFNRLIDAIRQKTGGTVDRAKGVYRRLKQAGFLTKTGHLWQVSKQVS